MPRPIWRRIPAIAGEIERKVYAALGIGADKVRPIQGTETPLTVAPEPVESNTQAARGSRLTVEG